ncbi:MAG: tRNA (adenosine(37)-N6)-threonylcarbamoyltransferase complex ATPase subunit type 1 TsaE [Coriobacteriales bacterium]|jgi:tRNA threonylcarbamoyladenosine biosynthesis protein TsaE|nr:tRNA (adenosine(37)-N6)-threonylcarbamoyltransferase complex ATPase subunit type 1 TsaE [Coriobacteriales bacterium]
MSATFTITTNSAEETQAFGAAFSAVLPAGAVLILSGDLGAGKTQFVKGLACGLGSEDKVTSPTFNIMHEYRALGWPVLYHFDLYRLDDSAQLDDLDYFAYLDNEIITVVEWGDRFSDALPGDYLRLAFSFGAGNERRITVSARGSLSTRALAAWD